MNDSQITLAPRTAIDRTLPALTVELPDTPDVIGADRIRFTGTTDVTDSPNTIVAYYADAAGGEPPQPDRVPRRRPQRQPQ